MAVHVADDFRDEEDSDLHDLLAGSKGGKEMAPLNLETLSMGDLDVPMKRSNTGCNLGRLCCAYLVYFCEYAPRCCLTMAIVALIIPTTFLVMALTNPTEQFGVIPNDYTDVRSQYELSVGKIDHWCLKGDNDSCRCEDPLQPQPRGEFRQWSKTHGANKEAVEALMSIPFDPDIAFLGGSIIEEMDGRWFGDTKDDMLSDLEVMFRNNFSKKNGADLEAVALGIAGDTNPSVLWRILNGEIPDNFNPKIWWLELGMNDLGRAQCSEEVVVLGVLRVVEEILNKKPDAAIVINSMFPMADLRGSNEIAPLKKEFKDFSPKHHKRNYEKKELKHEAKEAKHEEQLLAKAKKKEGEEDRLAEKREKKHNKHKEKSTGERRRLGFVERLRKKKTDKLPEVKIEAHKTTQKKFNPITHREHQLPLWTSITSINRELRRFVQKNDRVYFFDATEIFTDRVDGKYDAICLDKISVRGHPTKKGFAEWEKAVAERAKSLLKELDPSLS